MGASLADQIRAKQDEISSLDARIEADTIRRDALIAELVEVKRLVLESLGTKTLPPSHGASSSFNSTAMAEGVLRRIGHPLHISEIIAGIERQYGKPVKYATLVGNISRLIKNDKIFTRTGRNVFGLRAWEEEREADRLFREEVDRRELPDDPVRGEYDT